MSRAQMDGSLPKEEVEERAEDRKGRKERSGRERAGHDLRSVRTPGPDGVPVRARQGQDPIQPADVGGAVHRHPRRAYAEARLKELEAQVEDFDDEERARYDDLMSRLLSPKEIMELPDEPISELLGPLVVKGERIMLGAAKGHGKTSMALQILRAILFGEEFIDFTGIGDTRALIVDAEQGGRTIKKRIAEAGLEGVPRSIMGYWRIPEGVALDQSEAERVAIETRLAMELYDVVIFDPFYMLHEGDSKDDVDAKRLMKILDDWRMKYEFALILPTHTKKPGADRYKFTMHDFFGSSLIPRNANVVLGLEKKKYGQAKLHLFADRHGDLLELFKDDNDVWGLQFRPERGFTRGEVSDARKDKTKRSLRKVERALTEHPKSDIYELKELTGLGRSAVERQLKELNPSKEQVGKRLVYWL